MAMTAPKKRTVFGNNITQRFVEQGIGTLYDGSMVACNYGSRYGIEPGGAFDQIIVGIACIGGDSSVSTVDGDARLLVITGDCVGPFANSAGVDEILVTDQPGRVIFAVDGNTVARTDQTGTLPPAGTLARREDDGTIYVDFTRAAELRAIKEGLL